MRRLCLIHCQVLALYKIIKKYNHDYLIQNSAYVKEHFNQKILAEKLVLYLQSYK